MFIIQWCFSRSSEYSIIYSMRESLFIYRLHKFHSFISRKINKDDSTDLLWVTAVDS